MPGPLTGIKIVDCSAYITGPLATMILADQGAEVVKIEPLTIGDVMRHLGTARGHAVAQFQNRDRLRDDDFADDSLRRLVGLLCRCAAQLFALTPDRSKRALAHLTGLQGLANRELAAPAPWLGAAPRCARFRRRWGLAFDSPARRRL